MTYPLVGNYGVPNDKADECGLPLHFEGARIYPVVVDASEYSFAASRSAIAVSLAEWLQENSVPGILGVDTRAVTKRSRDSPCKTLRCTATRGTTSSVSSSTT